MALPIASDLALLFSGRESLGRVAMNQTPDQQPRNTDPLPTAIASGLSILICRVFRKSK